MPAGTDIVINTGTMRAAARVVENQMNVVMSCFESIRGDALGLKGKDWEGDSSDVYCDSMEKLCNSQLAGGTITAGYIISTLQEYVADLNKAADDFETNEQKLETASEVLPSDIFGI